MKHCTHKTEGNICGDRVILIPDKTKDSERVTWPDGGFVWMYPLVQGDRCYFHDKIRQGILAKTSHFTR